MKRALLKQLFEAILRLLVKVRVFQALVIQIFGRFQIFFFFLFCSKNMILKSCQILSNTYKNNIFWKQRWVGGRGGGFQIFSAGLNFFLQACGLCIWAAARENVPLDFWAQQWLKSACKSMQSEQSSLSTWRNFASLNIQNLPSEDSEQTARMCSLIRIFAEQHLTVLFLTSQLWSGFKSETWQGPLSACNIFFALKSLNSVCFSFAHKIFLLLQWSDHRLKIWNSTVCLKHFFLYM